MNQLQKAAAILGKKGGEAGTGKAKARPIFMARAAARLRWGNVSREDRFWSHVSKGLDNECWNWTGCLDQKGYGCVGFDRRIAKAHRVAWFFTFGPFDETKLVCHSCDNPSCCNPKHLFLGTNAENMADMRQKKRQCKGTKKWSNKLSELQVLEIRATYRRGVKGFGIRILSARYGVSQQHIRNILALKKWNHI